MSELVRELRVLIARDRETADIWERQCEERWPRNPRESVASPPARAGADIRNWINWLRNRADELEELVNNSTLGPPGPPVEPS